MNQLRKKKQTATRRPSAWSMKAKAFMIKLFRALNLFEYIEIRTAVQTLPFLLFLSGMALLFIANSYYTEHTIREIDKAGKEIRELKSEYLTTKSDLMQTSIQSQVAEAVAPLGLKESREAPAKIKNNDDPRTRRNK